MTDTQEPREIPERHFTIRQVAKWLQLSPRTIQRYVDAGMFENYIVLPHTERKKTLFTQASLDTFKSTYGANLTTPERPRRAYNRRIVKGKRKRKK